MAKLSSQFNVLNIVTIILGLFLVFANFKLLEANRALRGELQAAQRKQALEPGSVVPPLRGVDSDGELVQYGFDTEPRSTLLFILSPKCGVCDKNWGNWQEIITSVPEGKYRLLFANLDIEPLPKAYIKLHGFSEYGVIDQIDPQSKIDYQTGYTPQTILIDSEGRVQQVWTGILTFPEERIQELKDTLGVDLAGADK